MVKSERRHYWENREEVIVKNKNKVMKNISSEIRVEYNKIINDK